MDAYNSSPYYSRNGSGPFSGSSLSQNAETLQANHSFSEGSSSGALSYQPSVGQRMQSQQSFAPHPHATFYPEDLQPSYLHDPRTVSAHMQPPSNPFGLVNVYKPPDLPPVSKVPTPSEMAILLAPSGRLPLPLPPEAQAASYPAPEEELTVSRERKHACSMCHKRFDRPSTLRKHLLVHTGEKAFQCETCGRRFGVASNLNRHVRRCILKPVNTQHSAQASNPAPNSAIPSSSSDTPVSISASAPETNTISRQSDTSASTTSDSMGTENPVTTSTTPRRSRPTSRARPKPANPTAVSPSSTDSPQSLVHIASPNPPPPPPPPPHQLKRRRRAPSPSRWVPSSLLGFVLVPPQKQKSTPVPLPPVSPTQTRRSVVLDGQYVFSDPTADQYAVPSGVLTSRTQNSTYSPGTGTQSTSYPNTCSAISLSYHYPADLNTANADTNASHFEDALVSLSSSLGTLTLYEERDSYDETVGTAPYHPREWELRPILPGPGILSLLSRSTGGMISGIGGGGGSGDMNGNGTGMGVFSVFGYRSSNSGYGGRAGRGDGGFGNGEGKGARQKSAGRRASGGYQEVRTQVSQDYGSSPEASTDSNAGMSAKNACGVNMNGGTAVDTHATAQVGEPIPSSYPDGVGTVNASSNGQGPALQSYDKGSYNQYYGGGRYGGGRILVC